MDGLKHQEKRSMDHFAGLDVSVKDTSLCIVDGTGKIVREVKVASEPDALLQVLRTAAYTLSGSDWNLDRCRNGCSVRSRKPTCAQLRSQGRHSRDGQVRDPYQGVSRGLS